MQGPLRTSYASENGVPPEHLIVLRAPFRLLSFIRTWIFRTLSPFLISSYSTYSSTDNHISPIGFPQKKSYALTLQTFDKDHVSYPLHGSF
ncbi:hypothetical protein TNCV_1429511 [Trichonephila clavipes]|nr:hypothetical protein TNCV_1429511 [Trichonephila clavipes]